MGSVTGTMEMGPDFQQIPRKKSRYDTPVMGRGVRHYGFSAEEQAFLGAMFIRIILHRAGDQS